VAAYLDPVREVVQPVDVGLFAGVMDYSKLLFIFRLMMKAMGSPEGDFRDWEAIRDWASQVRARRSTGRVADEGQALVGTSLSHKITKAETKML
jgi:hypothetical protein